jgi:copper chaperone CopZ
MSNTRTYSVPDISCQHCVDAITGEVTKTAGVTAVHVDLEAKCVSVDGGAVEDVVAAIDEAGFDAEVIA